MEIQNQKLEQKIQENQEEVKTQEVVRVEKKIRLKHVLNGNRYSYSSVEIYIDGEVNLNGRQVRISRNNGLYIYANDGVNEVISRVEDVMKELEAEVISRANNLILINNAIREYAEKNGIVLEIE